MLSPSGSRLADAEREAAVRRPCRRPSGRTAWLDLQRRRDPASGGGIQAAAVASCAGGGIFF